MLLIYIRQIYELHLLSGDLCLQNLYRLIFFYLNVSRPIGLQSLDLVYRIAKDQKLLQLLLIQVHMTDYVLKQVIVNTG